jgi:hypothetical protein
MRFVCLGIAALLTVAIIFSTDAISTGIIHFWLSLTERQQAMLRFAQPVLIATTFLALAYQRRKARKLEGESDGASAS